jgi:uncharacterized protein YbcI
MYFIPVLQLHTIAWEESLTKAERRLCEYKAGQSSVESVKKDVLDIV